VTLPRLGLPLVDLSDVSNFAKQQENNKVFCREFGNPKLDVLDLKSISAKPRN
jgi:O-acetylhomoserine (thiol)-lyase